MDKDFLDVIKKAESEADAKIEEAKRRAAEIEKEGMARAENHLAESRKKCTEENENKLSEAHYAVKKKYDNKKTFMTVALNDKKNEASARIDKAAALIVERILAE